MWAYETAATLPYARRRKALRRPRGSRGAGHRGGRPPTACLIYDYRNLAMSFAVTILNQLLFQSNKTGSVTGSDTVTH